ncbi:hypothetical protein GCM10009127_24330 [Alteraurantiacibacter aestuarii]
MLCCREIEQASTDSPIHKGQDKTMADSQDLKAAEKTYGGFISLLKWTIPLIAILVFFVLLIIS